ncbi:hypothetical protein CerSpe_086600 [Prunus speciosa]
MKAIVQKTLIKSGIQNGAVFGHRPLPYPPTPALRTHQQFRSNVQNISSAVYDPTWLLLRRNLTSEILHPSRIKSYGEALKWVPDIIINLLRSKFQAQSEGIRVELWGQIKRRANQRNQRLSSPLAIELLAIQHPQILAQIDKISIEKSLEP